MKYEVKKLEKSAVEVKLFLTKDETTPLVDKVVKNAGENAEIPGFRKGHAPKEAILAETAGAIIIGYNVRPTTKAIKEAEISKVEIRTSSIIYHITEDIEKALAGMLEPEFKENYLGRIEIKKVFKVSKVGNVAGCVVVDGKVRNDANIRILRDNVVLYEGKLSSLKRFKDDAKEVVVGQECGLGVENFNDIKEGDVVEAFEMVEVKRTLK